jgi:hypothetical protein
MREANSPIHPDDLPALTRNHQAYLGDEDGLATNAAKLQDDAYALGYQRGITGLAATLVPVRPAPAEQGDPRAVMAVEYYIGNPSAWEHGYSDNVSEAIREFVAQHQRIVAVKDAEIARLTDGVAYLKDNLQAAYEDRLSLRAQLAQHQGAPEGLMLDQYDAGLLSDFGGGNVEWWQDCIRAELDRAHDFYQSQLTATLATSAGLSGEAPGAPRPFQLQADALRKAQGILTRWMVPDGIAAEQALTELIAVLDNEALAVEQDGMAAPA